MHQFQILPEYFARCRLGNTLDKLYSAHKLLVAGDLLPHEGVDTLLRQTLVSPDNVGPGHLSLPLTLDSDNCHILDP